VLDKFLWKWTSSSCYSASLAYRAFFVGQTSILGAKELHKVRAPQVCKFFLWLALLGRWWTSERLQRHSLPNSGVCAFCAQRDETLSHLLLTCVYSREVLRRSLAHGGSEAASRCARVLTRWSSWFGGSPGSNATLESSTPAIP
jgi:hypothetical protein